MRLILLKQYSAFLTSVVFMSVCLVKASSFSSTLTGSQCDAFYRTPMNLSKNPFISILPLSKNTVLHTLSKKKKKEKKREC